MGEWANGEHNLFAIRSFAIPSFAHSFIPFDRAFYLLDSPAK
jgi:hypothetical protein